MNEAVDTIKNIKETIAVVFSIEEKHIKKRDYKSPSSANEKYESLLRTM